MKKIFPALLAAFILMQIPTLAEPQDKLKPVLEKNSANYTVQDVIIKREVQTAISMLAAINSKVIGKELTLDQAKKLGADLLRDLRYGDDKEDYFFADTVEGVNVVLYGRKDVEGINRYDANIHDVYYVKEFIAKGRQGGGYTDYWFPKKDGKDPLRKRSYSLLFEPFGWIVSTGYYLEDEAVPKREP
jgi:methyl-accepting chemotaxis protein